MKGVSSNMDSCNDPHFDIIIVGAGLFGTSTAYRLSQTYANPSRVLVIDRAPCPSPQAASSDINKIVRADYSKEFYMNLAYEAMDGWCQDPILSQYYHNTGWILLDEKGSDLSERIRKNLKASGKPDTSSDRSLDDVARSWGGVLSGTDMTDFERAYFNSAAGWADASLAVCAWMEEALSFGVQYIVGEAELVVENRQLIGVNVNNKVYRSRKILLASGAWTAHLLGSVEQSLQIGPQHSIDRQIKAAGVCVAAFRLGEDEARYYRQMPVLIYGSKGEVMPPNRDGMFKFTNSHTFLNTVSVGDHSRSIPHPDQETIPPLLKQQSIELIRQRIPEILKDRQPDYWRMCWDAVSPDQNQLICQHPLISNLYLATAGSFHSWKFLPNIGKYVINVLNGKSNGEEKDRMWSWKYTWSNQGAHPKVIPRSELSDFQ